MQLSEQIIQQSLSKLGIQQLNPMQQASIEACKEHSDVVLLSPTGSGKSLAFLLPVLAQLQLNEVGIQALIISPTRELAIQLTQVFQAMSTGFKVSTAYGGHSMQVEANSLSEAPALLIGTPGRLVDHINRRHVDFRTVRVLVLDEFDKSLEMGFHEDISQLLRQLPNLQQRLLISATKMDEYPPFLEMENPHEIQFLNEQAPDITIHQLTSSTSGKLDTLFDLLCQLSTAPTLIFCNHREEVERVSEAMYDMGIPNHAFHGGLEQDERERALIQFRNGSAYYLVTTDLGSRGLDIPDIAHVIHYQLPLNEEAYIHRNGRTARQQKSGDAYLLMSTGEYVPTYITKEPLKFEFSGESQLPESPRWVTIYFSAGKKDKINKIDFVGFLSKIGGLSQEEIGLIHVLDFMSFVAIDSNKAHELLARVRNEKVKGKKLKIALAK